jgi:hypothetical protein
VPPKAEPSVSSLPPPIAIGEAPARASTAAEAPAAEATAAKAPAPETTGESSIAPSSPAPAASDAPTANQGSSAPIQKLAPSQTDAEADSAVVVRSEARGDAERIATAPTEAFAAVGSEPALKPAAKKPAEPGPRASFSSAPLIDDLFVEIHDLQFMPDLMSGVRFVARLLSQMLPVRALVVHVHDINTREFVVVRVEALADSGVAASKLRLFRTSDGDADIAKVMGRVGVQSHDPDTLSESSLARFARLGVVPVKVVTCPVQHERRYLGMFELLDPVGGAFSIEQEHALEYLAGQFADFVAARPLVYDDEADGDRAPSSARSA